MEGSKAFGWVVGAVLQGLLLLALAGLEGSALAGMVTR